MILFDPDFANGPSVGQAWIFFWFFFNRFVCLFDYFLFHIFIRSSKCE